MAQSEQQGGYLSRSWAMLTHDKGWYKPLLLMPLAMLVPIVGPLGVRGYGYEWARLSAWGFDTHPKQRNVKVGACIASGWRTLVASLGYMVLFGLVWLALWRPGENSSLGWFLWAAVGALWSVITTVAALRATVYQNFKAGYGLSQVGEMLRRDFRGILRIALVDLVLTLALEGLGAVLLSVLVASSLRRVLYLYFMMGAAADAASQVAGLLTHAIPGLVLVLYLLALLVVTVRLLVTNMVGLWMSQFDVPSWGSRHDPLPHQGTADEGPAAGSAGTKEDGEQTPELPALPPAPDDPVAATLREQDSQGGASADQM